MISTTFRLLPVLLLLLVVGCSSDSPTSSGTSQVMPLGTWVRVHPFSEGGADRQLISTVMLTSQSTGTLRDSFFTKTSGAWAFDSTSALELHFSSVGDGYLRAREVDRRIADTTVRYWYFFKKNDSLYYYRGMRFLGRNAGLAGTWLSDSADHSIDGRSYTLNFNQGRLSYDALMPGAHVTAQYDYSVSGDTLNLHGGALPFGDRYELFTGWSLYITNHAEGHARRS